MTRSRCSLAFATLIGILFLGISLGQLRFANGVAAQTQPVTAPVPVWSPTGGPQDAQVFSLFSAPGQLLAATSSGVWVSTDFGRNWQKRNTGLPDAVFPFSFAALDNTIFVGTRTGVYRTTDGGGRWQSASVGLPASEILITLTTDAERLYALTYSNGLFVSTDQGESWTPISQGLPSNGLSMIARGTTLWTATTRGIYRSTDGGQSWARTNQGIPVNAVGNSFATDGEQIYVSLSGSGITQGAAPRGVFVWNEAAGRWNSVNDGLGGAGVNALHTLGSELYATTDKGVFRLEKTLWLAASNGLRGSATAITSFGRSLYVASGGDIFTSLNRGESWTPLNVRFDLASFFTAFAYNNAGAYVATPTGVYLRPNQVSAVWRRVSNGLTDSHIVDLTTQGQTLWAASRSGATYFSGNDGDTWTPRVVGLAGQTLTAIAANEERTFVGTQRNGVFSLLRRDGRDTWQPANEGLTGRSINDLLVDGATIYAATSDGIFRSVNGGALWTPVNKGLTLEIEKEPYEPESLAVDGTTLYAVLRPSPTDSETPIISAFPSGAIHLVFRSEDNGAQWTQVMLRTGVMADFRQIVASAQGLLALGPGEPQSGVFTFPPTHPSAAVWLSTDKGKTWNPADAGLLTGGLGFTSFFGSSGLLLGATPTQGLLALLNEPGVYVRDLVTMTCHYEVSVRDNNLPPTTAKVTIPVTATANNCAWRADSQSDWITIANATSGNGSGSVQLNIAANNTTTYRQGNVTIAGTTITLSQNPCEISAAPAEQRIEASGGTVSIRITAASACPWSIKTDAPWLTTATPSGTGNATVNLMAAANANNLPRTASIFVGGATLYVTQAAAQGSCVAQRLNPNEWVRGTASASTCALQTKPADFYSFTTTPGQRLVVLVHSLAGVEIVPYWLDANGKATQLEPLVRTAEFRGGLPLPAWGFNPPQAGTYQLALSKPSASGSGDYWLRLATENCSLRLQAPDRLLAANGDSGNLVVAATDNCLWQSVSTASWLRITAGESGTGRGTINFTADLNPGVAREAFILVGDLGVLVKQAAGASAARTFTGLDPSYAEAGATGLLLTVTGSGFTSASQVLWGDKALATTLVSATQLRAALLASELTAPGEVQVSVETPTPSVWRTPTLPFVVRPAEQFWAPTNGPGGGAISAVFQQGTRLWAGTDSGLIFSSADGGRRWQREGDLNRTIFKFAAVGNQLFVSVNNGVHRLNLDQRAAGWTELQFPEDEGLARFGPVSTLIAKNESVWALVNNRLYRARANSSQWIRVNVAVTDPINYLTDLVTTGNAASDPLYLAANRGDSTTFKVQPLLLVSTNEGETWRSLNSDFSESGYGFPGRLFAINQRLYFSTGGGVFRLNDRDQIERVGNAPDGTGQAPAYVTSLAVEGDTLYAAGNPDPYANQSFEFEPHSIFRLENSQWIAADNGLEENPAGAVAATSYGLFATTRRGVWQSTNRGNTWTERNEGLNATSVSQFAVSGNALFAAGNVGIHRTVDNGQTWTRSDYGLPITPSFAISTGLPMRSPGFGYWLNALAANGDTLYAALPSGVFRSTDQGQSWRNTGLVGYTTLAFGFNGAQVLAGAFKSSFDGQLPSFNQPAPGGSSLVPISINEPGVYRSTNGAGNWRISESSLFGDVPTALATLNGKVFAATSQSGIRVSDDNGLTWRRSDDGLGSSNVASVATVGSVLLAGTGEGLYRSTDQGQSWRLVNVPRALFSKLVAQGSTVYGLAYSSNLGFESFAFYRSTDLGETWVYVPNATGYRMLTIQPQGDRLFAGTEGNGVLMANLAPARATAVNAASYVGGELAPNSIATLFGSNLAMATQLATGADLPEELGGTRVVIRSSTGEEYTAKLFFVSPGQINFLMPQLPINAVPVQIFTTTASGEQSIADIQISELALGLFAANGNGQGVANALALRVKADGSSGYEPVFRFDPAQNRFVALPLDVSAANETLYLVLFGTGIERRVTLDKVSAVIGEQTARVVYAGPQGGFAGVEQLNIALPVSLAGRGEVELRVTVKGKAANTLKVAFK